MKTLDWEKYDRVMEEIEFGLRDSDLIDDAFEDCDTVDDVIDYILYYHDEHLFRDESFAISWLKENITIADFYMRRGELSDCDSIFELADKAHYLHYKEKFLTVKDEIQEVIDRYLQEQADNDDDDDDDNDDEY